MTTRHQADDHDAGISPEAHSHHAAHSTAPWVTDSVLWHVYPLGFVGAAIRPDSPAERHCVRGLDALIPWLDYAAEIGCTGLLLGPIFQSETHGYDTLDFAHIDDRLGGDAAFDRLAEACSHKGLRLILDGVFNHVGRNHPAVKAALAEDSDSPWQDVVALKAADEDASQAGLQSPESRLPLFEGHDSLVELNHDSPKTVEYVAEVMKSWLDRGADGWRLDAAYAVDPEFWARTLPLVRTTHPDTWIFGEVIHGDYPAFVRDSTADSVTQYELWKSIWSSISEGNFFELDWNLQRHNTFLDSFIPQTFISNHDVTRIASRVGAQGAILALAVLMTVGGTPSVYYGDEIGMTGIKEDRLGGDDAIRPPFPDQPGVLHINENAEKLSAFDAHRALIALRHRFPWLQQARTESKHLENRSYTYRSTSCDGHAWIVTQLNLDPSPYVTIHDAFGTQLYDSRQGAV